MYNLDTEIVNVEFHDQYHSANPPLYQTATFHQADLDSHGEFDYTRSGNPTRKALEVHLAKLMGQAHAAYVVSTGMSALDVIVRLLAPQEEVVAGLDLYGGSSRLLGYLKTKQHVPVHHVDTTNLEAVKAVLNKNTKIVLLESPTNPGIQICDVRAIAAATKELAPQALVVVDNTMMSPVNMNPFELGADIWYESATKYLSGHHDLMGGVIALKDPELSKQIFAVINMSGYGMSPFDCMQLLKGLKTLHLRFEKQQANAVALANHLQDLIPKYKGPKLEVLFPGFESHPGYEIHQKSTKGPGGVLSFRTHDVAISEKIINACKLFKISVSFGAVNSLISLPCKMSHASIDAKTRAERGFHDDIVRVCLGIENPADLIADLENAFKAAGVL